MSKPIINPFATTAQANPEGDKADWKIKTASNGLLFYFNTKTKKSQWEKPEVLKTPEERLNSTDWQEHTTGDGKVFYYNAKMKQSVWKMPPELKAIKEKQVRIIKDPEQPFKAELRKQMGTIDNKAAPGSKIAVSITSSIPTEQEAVDYGPNYENLPHDQAVKIFMELLRERTVPTMKWEQAQQIIKNDERFKVITSFSEQRKLFKEWVVQSKNQERQEYKQRMQRARESFRHMLEERHLLNSDSKYYKVFQLFMNDPRWKALEDREREQTFQDYLDDLYEKEREDRIQKTRHGREELRKILAADSQVTPTTKWDEICEKYSNNPVWNDLHEYDRIQVFSKWIIELDRLEHDEKRKVRRFQERKNREAFRELLKEHIERKTLTHKTKWRHFVHVIKDDKRFFDMLGQNGSTPRELFEDQIEILKDQHKRTKEDFKKIMKDTNLKVSLETTFQEFEHALGTQEEYKALDSKTKEYFFNYFIEKAKSKEKETQKKHKKALKRFARFLKGLSDIKPDSEYKTFEKAINENEQFAILTEQEKISQFNAYLQDLKNQDEGQISDEALDKAKKKKAKKKRNKRKRSYESSEGENPRDSSEERSESRSRSRSRDHRKKNKKDKRKDGKRSRSESEAESDNERKPEKKVQLDKDNRSEPMQEEKPREEAKIEKPEEKSQPQALEQKPQSAATEVKAMQEELPDIKKQSEVEKKAAQPPAGGEDDQEEREEGETRESGRLRSKSRSSRSESRERTKKKKDRKHSKKKSKKGEKGERKSKKKHRKRSYSPSDSSDAD